MIVTGWPLEHEAAQLGVDESRTGQPGSVADDRDRSLALARALEIAGTPCVVEARAGLALIVCDEAQQVRLASSDARVALLALAKRHGFTHIAVELAGHATT